MIFTTIAQAKKLTGLSYLGSINSSAKIIKNKKVSNNYTYIIYLAPANQSGYNVCAHSTPECRKGCLSTSGRAKMDINSGHNIIKNARIKKTKLFFEDQQFFMQWMIAEMKHYQKKALKDGYYFSVRLNGTSDIDWSDVEINGKNIFEIFSDTLFYDYTKQYMKFFNQIQNYHLTFSYTGKNEEQAIALLNMGYNVAVVFDVKKNCPLPTTFKGYEVIDGDLTDFRVNDGAGVVVGLRFKRIADKNNEREVLMSEFVIKPNSLDCTYKEAFV